jgi:hypothetical protein
MAVTLAYAAQSTGGAYSTISGSAAVVCAGGETLAIYCAGLSTSDIGAPTDSAGTCTKQTAAYNAFIDSSKTHGGWYTQENASAATHTITPPTIGGGSDGLIFVYKLTGMPTSLTVRTTAKASQVSNSKTLTLTTVGSATAGDIALGGRSHENSVGSTDTITQPSGWTSDAQYLNGSTNLPTDVSHFTVVSTGTLSGTWTSVDNAITDTSGAILVLVPLTVDTLMAQTCQ